MEAESERCTTVEGDIVMTKSGAARRRGHRIPSPLAVRPSWGISVT